MSTANFAYISNRFEDMKVRPYSIALAKTLEDTGNDQSLLLTGLGLRRQGDEEEAQRVLLSAVKAAPRSNQAKFALIEPWVARLIQGNAPDDIVEVAQSLTGPAAAVLAGRVATAQRDWKAVAALDPVFAQSRPTDLWFVEATKLMVEWRNNLANIERRTDYAAHAWQIIDLAIAVHPVPDLFAARVSAAYFADRPEEVLETARRLTFVLDAELESIAEHEKLKDSPVLEFRQRQIDVIKDAVNDVARRHELSEISVNEVITRLDELQDRAVEIARG